MMWYYGALHVVLLYHIEKRLSGLQFGGMGPSKFN
jgi:hypothetical protein